MAEKDVRQVVRERYGETARQRSGCCSAGCDCATSSSTKIGYSDQELASIPEGADLGLGCGNPTALASLQKGEVVLDLGSGAGIDCFLATQAVGPSGHVIGVDMTSDMIDRARANAADNAIENVEFRLGEIEHLPVADAEVDVIVSNCVINLSPDKGQVFREAYRALKPGGRLMISDIVQLKPLPDVLRGSVQAYVGCIAGALPKQEYLDAITAAGFSDVEIEKEVIFGSELAGSSDKEPVVVVDGKEMRPSDVGLSKKDAGKLADSMASIAVRAVKS